MAERKVLIKHYPKNFDHERIVKRGRGKDKLMMVRNMLPMSLRCNTCANYLYIGTKFNMRMEICNEETYLGIKVFRFYFKCTYCYAEVTFKTDPKNHDYVVEAGGTRNYEAIKDAQQAEKVIKKLKVDEKQENSMKYLQNKSYDSKREMELMEALEDIKNLNRRQAVIDPQDLLKNLIYKEEKEEGFDEDEEAQIDRKYEEMRERVKAEKMGQTFKTQMIGEIKEEDQEEQKEAQEERPQENPQPIKIEEKAVIESSASVQSKPEWKKLLNSSKKGASGKPKAISLIASMKKKIAKPTAHKEEREVEQQS